MSKVLWLCFVAGAACLPGWAQTQKMHRTPVASPIVSSAATISKEAQAELAGMVARAGVIFAGRVLEIAWNQGHVDVTFRVDEPVRGCNKQGVYVLREWTGLWNGEPARYRVGQRLLLLLTARGPSGMSAPVGGDEGIIPIAASAVEPLADAKGVAPAEDGSVAGDITGMTADLRWVLARGVRHVAYEDVQRPSPGDDEPLTPAQRRELVRPIAAGFSTASAQPSVGAVLDVLRSASGSEASPLVPSGPAGPVVHPIVTPTAGSAAGSGSGHEER